MKITVSKLVKAVGVVIHDPKVDRAAEQFAVLIAIRVLVAAGAGVEVIQLVQKLG